MICELGMVIAMHQFAFPFECCFLYEGGKWCMRCQSEEKSDPSDSDSVALLIATATATATATPFSNFH